MFIFSFELKMYINVLFCTLHPSALPQVACESKSMCKSNPFPHTKFLAKNQTFYFIESATSCHCGRLRSYWYIGAYWQSGARLSGIWHRIASLVGHAGLTTPAHRSMAHLEGSGRWRKEGLNSFIDSLTQVFQLIPFFYSISIKIIYLFRINHQ